MNKIRLIITSVISIVLVSMLLIGSTYSIFTTSDIDEDLNVYKTGDLNIKYSSNNVKITDVTPMTEEEADAVIPHRITVTNNGNVPYQFDVILTDTTSNESNTIDYQYIMTKVGYLEPKKLSNCTNNVIKEDVILLPGSSVDIDVRVWLSDNLSNSEIGKSFYAKLQIDGQAIYNDNTEIDNDILSLNYMTTSGTSNFRSDTYKTYIKQASFVDYIDTTNASMDITTNEKIMWDMSADTNKSNCVVAWLEDNGTTDENGNKYYNLYIGSKEIIYAKSLMSFFENMSTIETIEFSNLNTSLTTTMGGGRSWSYGGMFQNCRNLKELDVSSWDTSNVTSMGRIFNNCSSLTELDVSNFETSNVTNMANMFDGCKFLIYLDVSNFDTSNTTSMDGLFRYCTSLTELDVSKFNTGNVISMSAIFFECINLVALDISNFNTSNVTTMQSMFYSCRSLTKIDISNFETGNVTNMGSMFYNCNILTELDLSNFDTSKVTNMNRMFCGCGKLISLDVSGFVTRNVTNMGLMFDGCSSLLELDLSNFDTSKVTEMNLMFRNCSSLLELNLSSFDTSAVTDMSDMFNGCSNLLELDLSNFNTGNVTNMSNMFRECTKLTTNITIRNSNATYTRIFQNVATAKDSEGNYIGQITINYIPDDNTTEDVNESTEAIVDAMIATGTGNIEKACFGINCPVEGN